VSVGREPRVDARSAASMDTSVPRMLAAVFRVVAPTAILTALLYYFGWARTDAAARRAGLDESLFGFTTTDYVLRSVGPLLQPLGIALLAVVGVAVIAGVLRRLVRQHVSSGDLGPEQMDNLGWALLVVATIAILAGALLLPTVRTQNPGHLAGFLILAGALLLWALLSMGQIQREHLEEETQLRHELIGGGEAPAGRHIAEITSQSRGWILGAIAALVLVGLFAIVLRLAYEDGEASINDFARNLSSQPELIVTAPTPLDVDLPGVDVAVLPPSEDYQVGARFRYSGLRLLQEANNRLFLVTPDFGRTDKPWAVAVIPHTDDLRLDFVEPRPGRATPHAQPPATVSPGRGRSSVSARA